MSDANEVLNEMLEAVPDSYQKTVGFPTWDWLAAAAIPMAGLDGELGAAKALLDPANLTGEALEAYIIPRTGQRRTAATYATGELSYLIPYSLMQPYLNGRAMQLLGLN